MSDALDRLMSLQNVLGGGDEDTVAEAIAEIGRLRRLCMELAGPTDGPSDASKRITALQAALAEAREENDLLKTRLIDQGDLLLEARGKLPKFYIDAEGLKCYGVQGPNEPDLHLLNASLVQAIRAATAENARLKTALERDCKVFADIEAEAKLKGGAKWTLTAVMYAQANIKTLLHPAESVPEGDANTPLALEFTLFALDDRITVRAFDEAGGIRLADFQTSVEGLTRLRDMTAMMVESFDKSVPEGEDGDG